VEESNLVQNVSVLRRVLAADPEGREYIETVPKLGYRFVVPVRGIEPIAKPVAPSRRWLAVTAAAAGIAVVAAIMWRLPQGGSRASAHHRSIAVVGFHDLSGRAETAWLNRALAEMLMTELHADGGLRTLSGEEVAHLR